MGGFEDRLPDAPDWVELVGERQECAKFFWSESRQERGQVVSNSPLHYNKDNYWTDITCTPDENGVIETALYRATLFKTRLLIEGRKGTKYNFVLPQKSVVNNLVQYGGVAFLFEPQKITVETVGSGFEFSELSYFDQNNNRVVDGKTFVIDEKTRIRSEIPVAYPLIKQSFIYF